jgi:hypothetical protein
MTTIKEIESFKLSDAVTFHDTLNTKLFLHNKLIGPIRSRLMEIANDFMDEMGIDNIHIVDITISGSNAAFSYTDHSDLDLHIQVDMSKLSNDSVYQELFSAKKTIYNDTHDILVKDIPVELYIQDAAKPVVSVGEYSVKNDKWIKIPSKRRANFDQDATKAKYEKLATLAELALETSDIVKIGAVLDTIHRYRRAGLSKGGEFSPENLAYKVVRTQGTLTKLYALRDRLHSKRLSVEGQYTTEGASGYIPSNAEKNDPRFKTALSVDINPYTMKKSAKKFGWNISRAGIPPLLRK